MSVRNDVIQGIVDLMATGLVNTDTYGVTIRSVSQITTNLLTTPSHTLPAIVLTDTGGEEITTKGASGTQYIALIECRCIVNEAHIEDTNRKLNDVSGAVKAFIDSTTAWHPRCLHVGCSAVVGFKYDNLLSGTGETTLTLTALYYRLQGEV